MQKAIRNIPVHRHASLQPLQTCHIRAMPPGTAGKVCACHETTLPCSHSAVGKSRHYQTPQPYSCGQAPLNYHGVGQTACSASLRLVQRLSGTEMRTEQQCLGLEIPGSCWQISPAAQAAAPALSACPPGLQARVTLQLSICLLCSMC